MDCDCPFSLYPQKKTNQIWPPAPWFSSQVNYQGQYCDLPSLRNYSRMVPQQRKSTEFFTTTKSVLDMEWASGAFNEERMMVRTMMMILMKVEEMVEEDKDGYQLSSASIILAALDKSSLSVHSPNPAHRCCARRDNLSEKEYFLNHLFFNEVSTDPPSCISCNASQQRQEVLLPHVELAEKFTKVENVELARNIQ